MSLLVPGTSSPEFYFVAQYIIATLDEMYGDGRFGEADMDNVYMGPGSRAAASLLGFTSKRPTKTSEDSFYAMSDYFSDEEGELIFRRLADLKKPQLVIMGLYVDEYGVLRVRLTNRRVSFLDLEHFLCKMYLFLKKKSPPGMSSMQPIWHSFHCYPVKYNTNDLDPQHLLGVDGTTTFGKIASESVTSFEGMDFKMPWKFLLKDEWPNKEPWLSQQFDTDALEDDGTLAAATVASTIDSDDNEDEDVLWDPDAESEDPNSNVYYVEITMELDGEAGTHDSQGSVDDTATTN
jgi:hypothetical protein